jgi:hypothetical protein
MFRMAHPFLACSRPDVAGEDQRETLRHCKPSRSGGLLFVGCLAARATNGERQRLQPLPRDLAAAVGAVAILSGVETQQPFPDTLERLALHLNQGDFDVLLVVRLGVLGFVQSSGRPPRGQAADPMLQHALQLPLAVVQHRPQVPLTRQACA